jgi:hypothetical protein
MAYSQVGIVNLALQHLGVGPIADIDEGSTASIAALAVWEYILNEVLEAKDWRFAVTRVALAKNATAPTYGYLYAYDLPADFLRLAMDEDFDKNVYPLAVYGSPTTYYVYDNLIINNIKYSFKIETLGDDVKYLVTNYDNSSQDLDIKYIRKVTNPGSWSATFCMALSYRLGQQLASTLTEDKQKQDLCEKGYNKYLTKAEALNVASDSQPDLGNSDWVSAGR